MSNEPQTYYALIEFPDTTGEQSDELISFAEYFIRENVHEDATVVHLTPETLPDRYMVNDRTQVHLTNAEADVVWSLLQGRPEEAKATAVVSLLNKLEGLQ